MSATVKHLSYRGDIRAIAAFRELLSFTTVHVEGIPSALYQLNVESYELQRLPLPCGGVSLAVAGKDLLLGGTDGQIYLLGPKSKKLQTLPFSLSGPAIALAPVVGDNVVALTDHELVVVGVSNEEIQQRIELAEKATAVASDPTGAWVVVGDAKGNVATFHFDDAGQLVPGESAKLHEGAVTSLLFEPEELRFLSAGADGKLLLTHAQGALEPEDRGRGGGHTERVTGMMNVPGERFVTVSRDKTCKTWARGSATRPATFDDAVPEVVAATLIDVHSRPHLALAGADGSIRLILLDAGGRFGAMTCRIYDAYDRATNLLRDGDVGQRGEALHELADFDDARSVELIARQIGEDSDPGLRRAAAELLAKSGHARTPKLLEPLLKHKDGPVRMAALGGLQSAAGSDVLRPLKLAVEAKQGDVGQAAVAALEKIAKTDDQARQLLVRTLDLDPPEVRRSALVRLLQVDNGDDRNREGPRARIRTMVGCSQSRRDAILVVVLLQKRELVCDTVIL